MKSNFLKNIVITACVIGLTACGEPSDKDAEREVNKALQLAIAPMQQVVELVKYKCPENVEAFTQKDELYQKYCMIKSAELQDFEVVKCIEQFDETQLCKVKYNFISKKYDENKPTELDVTFKKGLDGWDVVI